MAVLELEGISAHRGTARVLDDLSLRIEEGEVVALLGPSGSGKSTILRVLLGLLAPDRGVVRIRDQVATEGDRIVLTPEARDLAVVFQDLALWPHLTVAGNLRFVLRSKKARRSQERTRIREALERVGLAEKDDRYPGQLSGGEQQRLAVARAFVLDPAAVLLDEPLANLDIVLKQELLALLRELFEKHGTTVLQVTHDPEEAAALTSNVVVVESGRVVYAGDLDRIATSSSTFGRAIGRVLRIG